MNHKSNIWRNKREEKKKLFFLNEENNSGGSENMAVFTLVFSLSQIWNLSDYSSVQRTTNLSPRHINGSAHITLWWLSDIFFALSAQILRFSRRLGGPQRVSGPFWAFSLLPLMPAEKRISDWIRCFWRLRGPAGAFSWFPRICGLVSFPHFASGNVSDRVKRVREDRHLEI